MKAISKVLSVFLLCMLIPLSVGTRPESMTRYTIEQTNNSSTGQKESVENNGYEIIYNKTVLDLKKYPSRLNKSLLFLALNKRFETIDKPQMNNSINRIKATSTNFEESVSTITSWRNKRNEECSDSLRRRSICPWVYEYSRNDTLLPELIKTISCQSTVTLMPHLTIQCHQLYTYKLFKKRNCDNDEDRHACLVRLRVKSGCLAAFPCVVHTSG